MKYILSILGLFFVLLTSAQNLSKKLVEGGGQLIIVTKYSIGEAYYSEQTVFIEKKDSLLEAKIFIDTTSYFVKHKNCDWHDTTIMIDRSKFKDFIQLEKFIFKKGIQPTYNCDGFNGRIIHNQTAVLFIYDKNKVLDKATAIELKLTEEMAKSVKMKSIRISGGFLSFKDELINLGLDFQRCKTFWWTNL